MWGIQNIWDMHLSSRSLSLVSEKQKTKVGRPCNAIDSRCRCISCRHKTHWAPEFSLRASQMLSPLPWQSLPLICGMSNRCFSCVQENKFLPTFFCVGTLLGIYCPKMFWERPFTMTTAVSGLEMFASLPGRASNADTPCLLNTVAWCCQFDGNLERILLFLTLLPESWSVTDGTPSLSLSFIKMIPYILPCTSFLELEVGGQYIS